MYKVLRFFLMLPWYVCKALGLILAILFFLGGMGTAAYHFLPPHLRLTVDQEVDRLQTRVFGDTAPQKVKKAVQPTQKTPMQPLQPTTKTPKTRHHTKTSEPSPHKMPKPSLVPSIWFTNVSQPSTSPKKPQQRSKTSPKKANPTTPHNKAQLQRNTTTVPNAKHACEGRQSLILTIHGAKIAPKAADGQPWDCSRNESTNSHWVFASIDLVDPNRCAPDPYLIATNDAGRSFQTPIIRNQYFPKWDTTIRFDRFRLGQAFELSLYDSNQPLRSDNHMESFRFVPTKEMLLTKRHLTLKGSKGVEALEFSIELKSDMKPFKAGLYDLTVAIVAPDKKENGKRWDNPLFGSAAPDLALRVGVGAKSTQHPKIYKNAYKAGWLFRKVEIRVDDRGRLTIIDKDLYFDDLVARCDFAFRDLCLDEKGVVDNLARCGRATLRMFLKKKGSR